MDAGNAHRQVLSRLRKLLAEGQTIRTAASDVNLSPTSAYRLAVRHSLPRRTRAEKAAAVETAQGLIRAARLSNGEIARRLNLHEGTISRLRQLIVDRDSQAEFRPRRVRKARRCPTCGHKVKVWPCVMCRALGRTA